MTDMSYPGRHPFSSQRGRGGRGFPVIQQGKKSLYNQNISGIGSSSKEDKVPKEFQEFLRQRGKNIPMEENSSKSDEEESYSAVAQKEYKFFDSPKRELTLVIENDDETFKESPWILMDKYLPANCWKVETYKTRGFYENILTSLGSVDIQHYPPKSKIINYSKFVIKKIISIQEWGTSPFAEKTITNEVTRSAFQYNYWDYLQSFYKTLFYQNPKHSHTWLIKLCDNISRNQIPNWLFSWWETFGAMADILPEEIKTLLEEYSISFSSFKTHNTGSKTICMFFVDSGIPWVWKWKPQFGFTTNGTPCLWRIHTTRFWNNLNVITPGSNESPLQENIQRIKSKMEDHKKISTKKTSYSLPSFSEFSKQYADIFSKEKIMDLYMDHIKKDLFDDIDFSDSKSDASMSSVTDLQDAQDPNDDYQDLSLQESFDLLKSSLKEKIKGKD
ncbi:hypothetical protein ABFX02_06G147000 [Erythranthe guttata]